MWLMVVCWQTANALFYGIWTMPKRKHVAGGRKVFGSNRAWRVLISWGVSSVLVWPMITGHLGPHHIVRLRSVRGPAICQHHVTQSEGVTVFLLRCASFPSHATWPPQVNAQQHTGLGIMTSAHPRLLHRCNLRVRLPTHEEEHFCSLHFFLRNR